MEGLKLIYEPEQWLHLQNTLRLTTMGGRDPCVQRTEDHHRQAFQMAGGVVVASVQQDEQLIDVTLTGRAAESFQDRVEGWLGLHDRADEFQPSGPLRRLTATMKGTRISQAPVCFHRLVQIVLQQLVSWDDAASAWRNMVLRFGERVQPDLHAPPTPATLSRLGYFDLVDCGALPRQARLIIQLARLGHRIDRLVETSADQACQYLQTIPGVGPWTIGYFQGFALGQPDALLPNDYAIPHYVSWFLKRRPRSDDEEMFELLNAFPGHRFRAVQWVMLSGVKPPRYGPKMASNRWRK